MTTRWIWLVPSKICSTFASRMYRSTGWSATYPAPPSTCTASVVTRIAMSVAKSFAFAASMEYGRPGSRRRGGCLGRRLGGAKAKPLEVDDRPAELLPLLGVPDRVVEGGLGQPDRA